jgi:hypothetical protein
MKITGRSTREMFLRYDTVDSLENCKAIDQNFDQVPFKWKKG